MRGIRASRVRTGAALAVALLVGGVAASCTPPTEPIVTFPAADGPSAVVDTPNELRGPLRVRGRDLVDADGRVVQLRGTNAVQKSAPFLYSVTDGKLAGMPVAELVRRGYNAVRLGVWPAALMPTPGGVDTAYLEQVAQTVADLEDAGLWVLLDLHQDVFWGMPSWATPADAVDLSEAPAPGFEVIGWAAGYTSAKSLRQWDAFWHNEPVAPGLGMVDAYGVGVQALAARMKDAANVVGIELLNEPFPGTPYVSCVAGGCPELDWLVTARSTELTNAVRAVAPRLPVWWEAESLATMYSLPQMTVDGVTAGPDGPAVGLSFHAYCHETDGGRVEPVPPATQVWCTSSFNRAFDNAGALAAGWDAPRFLTEFGASGNPYNATVPGRLADEQLVSWLHWSIGTYADEVEVHLQRTYPQATAGTPEYLRFDPATGRTTFRYRPDHSLDAPTVLALAARAYPDGYSATVAGGTVTSAPDAGRLVVEADPGATSVTVTVTRR